jgi:hypothetical protein
LIVCSLIMIKKYKNKQVTNSSNLNIENNNILLKETELLSQKPPAHIISNNLSNYGHRQEVANNLTSNLTNYNYRRKINNSNNLTNYNHGQEVISNKSNNLMNYNHGREVINNPTL